MIVVDNGWLQCGISSEIITIVAENAFNYLKAKPVRIGMEDVPSPSTRALTKYYYPRAIDIGKQINTEWDNKSTVKLNKDRLKLNKRVK